MGYFREYGLSVLGITSVGSWWLIINKLRISILHLQLNNIFVGIIQWLSKSDLGRTAIIRKIYRQRILNRSIWTQCGSVHTNDIFYDHYTFSNRNIEAIKLWLIIFAEDCIILLILFMLLLKPWAWIRLLTWS